MNFMFDYAYDLSGSLYPVVKVFDVLNSQAILKGELVRFTDGYIVPGGSDYTTPYTGVATQGKVANDGIVRIEVYCSTTAVFKTDPISTVVSASPSATVWTDTVGLLNTTANAGKGGKLKIVSKAAGATGTYVPGAVIPLTATATNTLTGVFPGNTAVGDVGLFFPAINKVGATATATDATGLVWAATSGTAIEVVGHDLDNNKVLVISKLHSFSN